MRTDEAVFLYTQPCVSGRDRKTKPARWPVDPRARDIRVYKNRFQPPDCVPDIPPTPDILHGSYLGKTEQSPASSHNTPVLSHTRSVTIAAEFLYVKKNFVISGENFSLFLCTAPKMVAKQLQVILPLLRAFCRSEIPHVLRACGGLRISTRSSSAKMPRDRPAPPPRTAKRS